jgi:hypothetical protein
MIDFDFILNVLIQMELLIFDMYLEVVCIFGLIHYREY